MRAKRSIIPVFVPHYGCPNDCVFCNQRKISGSVSPPDKQQLFEIITQALEKTPEEANIQLAFYGGSFTAIPPWEQEMLLEGALPFLTSGQITSLRVSTRPDCVDENALSRLKKYGVSTIELGAQSMDERVLELSGRGHTADDTERSVRLIKAWGFELILQMMTGLPGDTREKSLQTARRLIALKPDGVRIYPTVIVENTPLSDLWQSGAYREHTLEEAADWCAEILPLFEAAGIPVIRLGLNPSDELSGGAALAGAYHPAFGEIVRSRRLYETARRLIYDAKWMQGELILGVNKSDVSPMTGQKRENIIRLCEEFPDLDIKVRAAEVERGAVILL